MHFSSGHRTSSNNCISMLYKRYLPYKYLISIFFLLFILFTFHTHARTSESSSGITLDHITLLLPSPVCSDPQNPPKYTLTASGGSGCYRWQSNHPHLVTVTPSPEHRCRSNGVNGSTQALITVVPSTNFPVLSLPASSSAASSSLPNDNSTDASSSLNTTLQHQQQAADTPSLDHILASLRQSAWIVAEDLKTSQRAECEVYLDIIRSLFIKTSTKRIIMHEREMFAVQAYDEHLDVFSTLHGLQFQWSVLSPDYAETIPHAGETTFFPENNFIPISVDNYETNFAAEKLSQRILNDKDTNMQQQQDYYDKSQKNNDVKYVAFPVYDAQTQTAVLQSKKEQTTSSSSSQTKQTKSLLNKDETVLPADVFSTDLLFVRATKAGRSQFRVEYTCPALTPLLQHYNNNNKIITNTTTQAAANLNNTKFSSTVSTTVQIAVSEPIGITTPLLRICPRSNFDITLFARHSKHSLLISPIHPPDTSLLPSYVQQYAQYYIHDAYQRRLELPQSSVRFELASLSKSASSSGSSTATSSSSIVNLVSPYKGSLQTLDTPGIATINVIDTTLHEVSSFIDVNVIIPKSASSLTFYLQDQSVSPSSNINQATLLAYKRFRALFQYRYQTHATLTTLDAKGLPFIVDKSFPTTLPLQSKQLQDNLLLVENLPQIHNSYRNLPITGNIMYDDLFMLFFQQHRDGDILETYKEYLHSNKITLSSQLSDIEETYKQLYDDIKEYQEYNDNIDIKKSPLYQEMKSSHPLLFQSLLPSCDNTLHFIPNRAYLTRLFIYDDNKRNIDICDNIDISIHYTNVFVQSSSNKTQHYIDNNVVLDEYGVIQFTTPKETILYKNNKKHQIFGHIDVIYGGSVLHSIAFTIDPPLNAYYIDDDLLIKNSKYTNVDSILLPVSPLSTTTDDETCGITLGIDGGSGLYQTNVYSLTQKTTADSFISAALQPFPSTSPLLNTTSYHPFASLTINSRQQQAKGNILLSDVCNPLLTYTINVQTSLPASVCAAPHSYDLLITNKQYDDNVDTNNNDYFIPKSFQLDDKQYPVVENTLLQSSSSASHIYDNNDVTLRYFITDINGQQFTRMKCLRFDSYAVPISTANGVPYSPYDASIAQPLTSLQYAPTCPKGIDSQDNLVLATSANPTIRQQFEALLAQYDHFASNNKTILSNSTQDNTSCFVQTFTPNLPGQYSVFTELHNKWYQEQLKHAWGGYSTQNVPQITNFAHQLWNKQQGLGSKSHIVSSSPYNGFPAATWSIFSSYYQLSATQNFNIPSMLLSYPSSNYDVYNNVTVYQSYPVGNYPTITSQQLQQKSVQVSSSSLPGSIEQTKSVIYGVFDVPFTIQLHDGPLASVQFSYSNKQTNLLGYPSCSYKPFQPLLCYENNTNSCRSVHTYVPSVLISKKHESLDVYIHNNGNYANIQCNTPLLSSSSIQTSSYLAPVSISRVYTEHNQFGHNSTTFINIQCIPKLHPISNVVYITVGKPTIIPFFSNDVTSQNYHPLLQNMVYSTTEPDLLSISSADNTNTNTTHITLNGNSIGSTVLFIDVQTPHNSLVANSAHIIYPLRIAIIVHIVLPQLSITGSSHLQAGHSGIFSIQQAHTDHTSTRSISDLTYLTHINALWNLNANKTNSINNNSIFPSASQEKLEHSINTATIAVQPFLSGYLPLYSSVPSSSSSSFEIANDVQSEVLHNNIGSELTTYTKGYSIRVTTSPNVAPGVYTLSANITRYFPNLSLPATQLLTTFLSTIITLQPKNKEDISSTTSSMAMFPSVNNLQLDILSLSNNELDVYLRQIIHQDAVLPTVSGHFSTQYFPQYIWNHLINWQYQQQISQSSMPLILHRQYNGHVTNSFDAPLQIAPQTEQMTITVLPVFSILTPTSLTIAPSSELAIKTTWDHFFIGKAKSLKKTITNEKVAYTITSPNTGLSGVSSATPYAINYQISIINSNTKNKTLSSDILKNFIIFNPQTYIVSLNQTLVAQHQNNQLFPLTILISVSPQNVDSITQSIIIHFAEPYGIDLIRYNDVEYQHLYKNKTKDNLLDDIDQVVDTSAFAANVLAIAQQTSQIPSVLGSLKQPLCPIQSSKEYQNTGVLSNLPQTPYDAIVAGLDVYDLIIRDKYGVIFTSPFSGSSSQETTLRVEIDIDTLFYHHYNLSLSEPFEKSSLTNKDKVKQIFEVLIYDLHPSIQLNPHSAAGTNIRVMSYADTTQKGTSPSIARVAFYVVSSLNVVAQTTPRALLSFSLTPTPSKYSLEGYTPQYQRIVTDISFGSRRYCHTPSTLRSANAMRLTIPLASFGIEQFVAKLQNNNNNNNNNDVSLQYNTYFKELQHSIHHVLTTLSLQVMKDLSINYVSNHQQFNDSSPSSLASKTTIFNFALPQFFINIKHIDIPTKLALIDVVMVDITRENIDTISSLITQVAQQLDIKYNNEQQQYQQQQQHPAQWYTEPLAIHSNSKSTQYVPATHTPSVSSSITTTAVAAAAKHHQYSLLQKHQQLHALPLYLIASHFNGLFDKVYNNIVSSSSSTSLQELAQVINPKLRNDILFNTTTMPMKSSHNYQEDNDDVYFVLSLNSTIRDAKTQQVDLQQQILQQQSQLLNKKYLYNRLQRLTGLWIDYHAVSASPQGSSTTTAAMSCHYMDVSSFIHTILLLEQNNKEIIIGPTPTRFALVHSPQNKQLFASSRSSPYYVYADNALFYVLSPLSSRLLDNLPLLLDHTPKATEKSRQTAMLTISQALTQFDYTQKQLLQNARIVEKYTSAITSKSTVNPLVPPLFTSISTSLSSSLHMLSCYNEAVASKITYNDIFNVFNQHHINYQQQPSHTSQFSMWIPQYNKKLNNFDYQLYSPNTLASQCQLSLIQLLSGHVFIDTKSDESLLIEPQIADNILQSSLFTYIQPKIQDGDDEYDQENSYDDIYNKYSQSVIITPQSTMLLQRSALVSASYYLEYKSRLDSMIQYFSTINFPSFSSSTSHIQNQQPQQPIIHYNTPQPSLPLPIKQQQLPILQQPIVSPSASPKHPLSHQQQQQQKPASTQQQSPTQFTPGRLSFQSSTLSQQSQHYQNVQQKSSSTSIVSYIIIAFFVVIFCTFFFKGQFSSPAVETLPQQLPDSILAQKFMSGLNHNNNINNNKHIGPINIGNQQNILHNDAQNDQSTSLNDTTNIAPSAANAGFTERPQKRIIYRGNTPMFRQAAARGNQQRTPAISPIVQEQQQFDGITPTPRVWNDSLANTTNNFNNSMTSTGTIYNRHNSTFQQNNHDLTMSNPNDINSFDTTSSKSPQEQEQPPITPVATRRRRSLLPGTASFRGYNK